MMIHAASFGPVLFICSGLFVCGAFIFIQSYFGLFAGDEKEAVVATRPCSLHECPLLQCPDIAGLSKSLTNDAKCRNSHDSLIPSVRQIIQERYSPPVKKDGAPGSEYLLDDPQKNDYSQYQQSVTLNTKYFKNKKNGMFFECGALDGEKYSNTLMYEKLFNWTGILVEANPAEFEKLKRKRRNAHIFNLCLTNSQTVSFLPFLMKAGGHSELADAQTGDLKAAEYVTVPCVSITQVLDFLNIKHLDYMVLDVEVGEPEILAGFDFNRFSLDVVQIELCGNCLKWQDEIVVVTKRQDMLEERYFLKRLLSIHGYVEAMALGGLDIVYKRKN